MLVHRGYVALSHGPRENRFRPAVDPLFRSAALAYGPAVVGVILTGHLDDGTAGLMAIKDQRGTTVVQDPLDAIAPSMPRSALASVAVDHRCNLAEMGALLMMLASDDPAVADPGARDELLATEVSLAEGGFTPPVWSKFEAMAIPVGINCPDCGGALFMLRDRRVIRFRCRAGHAFSAQSLRCAQSEDTENKLGTLLGAFSDEVALARLLLDAAVEHPVDLRAALHSDIQSAELRTALVSEWLRTSLGPEAYSASTGDQLRPAIDEMETTRDEGRR